MRVVKALSDTEPVSAPLGAAITGWSAALGRGPGWSQLQSWSSFSKVSWSPGLHWAASHFYLAAQQKCSLLPGRAMPHYLETAFYSFGGGCATTGLLHSDWLRWGCSI